MWKVEIYLQQDSRNRRPAGRRYAYRMECTTQDGTRHRKEGTGETEGTYHQATLLAACEALARINQSCEVAIFLEDSFVFSMFHSHMLAWAGREWKTSKGEEIANKEEWESLWRLSKSHLVRMNLGKHKYSEQLLKKCREERDDV